MKITLLGTGSCQLVPERIASSVLIELPELRLVYDFGRGVATRLVELGYRQDDIEHIVLSHFHADHISDLIPWLHAASYSEIDARTRDLHLYGPTGLQERMAQLFSSFRPKELVDDALYEVHLHEVLSTPLEVAGVEFEWADLPPAGNRGLAFTYEGQRIALTGDSDFHDSEIDFLRGADVAVFDSGHLTDDEIVELAVRTAVPSLICSHFYRELDLERLAQRAKEKGFTGTLAEGYDGLTLTLDSS